MKDAEAASVAVTVVVRSHDIGRKASLRRALFSIWSQDAANAVELLLVTSGYRRELKPADCVAHLGEAAGNYRPAGVRLFRHRALRLKGDTRARLLNVGLREARGDYIIFLDDDDVLRQDALSRLLDRAGESGADLIFGRVDIVFRSRLQAPELYQFVPYTARPPRTLDLVRHNIAPLCSFFFRRPAPERLPVVDESLCSFEDYAMLLQLLQHATTASVSFERAIAEYWIDNSVRSQAEKYRATIANDLSIVESMRRKLVFRVSGEEITGPAASADLRRALASLLAEAKRAPDESIVIHVDQALETKHGISYIGWAIDKEPGAGEVLYLFALQRDGGAVLVDVRYARADVALRWRLDDPLVGFSFSSRQPCAKFIAVSGGRLAEVDAPAP